MLTVLALIAWTAVAVYWNLRPKNVPALRLIDRSPDVRSTPDTSGKPGSDL